VLRKNVLDMATALLACGIDPAKTTLFVQSHVREHAELMWLLSCMTPMSWLNRMTQFKDKSKKKGGASNAPLGLYAYPVLQAADILLYRATGSFCCSQPHWLVGIDCLLVSVDWDAMSENPFIDEAQKYILLRGPTCSFNLFVYFGSAYIRGFVLRYFACACRHSPACLAFLDRAFLQTDVPVGEDQLQHLELARNIATTFNHTYKTDLLIPPKPVLVTGTLAREL
jgi:tryptophanyl-tRNA synthetase